MAKVAALVSGGGANLQPILDSYYFREAPEMELAAVISSAPGVYALERAKAAGIPCYVVERELFPNRASFCNALLNKLRDLDIEIVVCAGFSEELNYPFLHYYKNKVINVQPAIFPMFCSGTLDPVAGLKYTIDNGVRVAGATAYFMAEEDCGFGPIILQKTTQVLPEDNIASLQKRIMEECEWDILPRALKLCCQNRLKLEGNKVIILPQE